MSTKTVRQEIDALETRVAEALHDLSTCQALTNIDGFTQDLNDLAFEASELRDDPRTGARQEARLAKVEDALYAAEDAADKMSDAYTTAHLALSGLFNH